MFSYEEIRNMNELEMIVYQYVMKNKQKVGYMKIRELAQEAHVSTTTVLRFCKKLGCNGYSEFKIRFKMYLEQEAESGTNDDISNLMEYLKRVDSPEYQENLNRAAEILSNSYYILFIGVGTSGVLGRYGARYFSNMGWFSMCVDDPFTPIFRGHSDETAVVALSVSGETEQVLYMANRLKARGCRLISITNSPGCTLAKMSECNIAYHMPMRKVDGTFNITLQAPVVTILELLANKLYREKGGETSK